MGKRDGGHAGNDFFLVSKVKCAKFHQNQNVGQHQILQLVHFLIFLISKTTATMFPTTCESFIAIAWTVYAPLGKVQHQVLRLVQCLIFCKFSKPPRACYNNLWKLHRNRMNGVYSYTEDTHKHTQTVIFIYIKFPCTTTFESYIAIDERCVLL